MRNSPLQNTCGAEASSAIFLCFFFSFSYTCQICLLLLLAISRFMVVFHPFLIKRKTIHICAGVGTLSLILSILHSLLNNKSQTSNLCLPIGNTRYHRREISFLPSLFSAVLLSALGLLCAVVIPIVYSKIIHHVQQQTQATSSTRLNTRVERDKSLRLKAVVSCLSNTLTWLPCSIVFVFSSVCTTYPAELLIFTIVTIVPLNSLVCPFLLMKVTCPCYSVTP